MSPAQPAPTTRRLALFGSAQRDDFGPSSDLDVLVEFEPGDVPGLLRLAAMEREVSAMIGGLGVPRLRRGRGDIDLNGFEQPAGERTLQRVSDCQTETRIDQPLAAREREVEVVSSLDAGRPLQIGSRSVCAQYMVGVQIDQDTRMDAEPRLERQTTLQGPSLGCNTIEPRHQALQRGLPSQHVRGDPLRAGLISQP